MKEKHNPMWGELVAFVDQVEKEQKQASDAKPYIDQIRSILEKHIPSSSQLKTD